MENKVRIDGIWYKLNNENKTASVTHSLYLGDKYLGEVVIPEVVEFVREEYVVMEIGSSAFWDCSGVTSISIPESVTEIGSGAFSGCSGLTSITIPKSVTKIGGNAFSDCSGLTSITIPENVTNIECFTFYGCSGLTSITIPERVTKIERWAFSGCNGLTSITIPDAVTVIEREAFEGCSGLTSITIPENVKKISSKAFNNCSALTSIIVTENNVIYDSRNNCNAIIETKSNELIAGCSTTIIPESVTKIGWSAFEGCVGLTSIIIPENVTEIGWSAFEGCSRLTSITIPENVKKIGLRTFKKCSSLTSIIVTEYNVIYDSRNNCNAIIDTKSNRLIEGCSTTIIPESVTKIRMSAFEGCVGLTSIIIPENVTEIGLSAFKGCSGLKEIYCYNFSKDWNDTFDKSLVGNVTIHVPKYALDYVQKSFKKIVPIEAKVKKIELPTKCFLPEKSVHLLGQTITPSYATGQSLKWKSSNEEVAVVNSKGRVVALLSGTATITAMASDDSEVCASCEIVVRRMVECIQLNQTSVKLVAGNAFSLNAIVTPKDAYDTSLTWSTTDDDIAMILGNGRVVAVSAGTATITAKANDGSEVFATCEVVVTEK